MDYSCLIDYSFIYLFIYIFINLEQKLADNHDGLFMSDYLFTYLSIYLLTYYGYFYFAKSYAVCHAQSIIVCEDIENII
jgi:hypothetical protein